MRSILLLSLLLLALALVARLAGPGASAGAGGLADRAVDVQVEARGRMLPGPRGGAGREWTGASVCLGERTFLAPPGFDGILAVRLDLATDEADEWHLASTDPEATRVLASSIALPAPALLALASQGTLTASAELNHVLADLGASVALGAASPESFALIARRTVDGWTALAQGHSTGSGVQISRVVGVDAPAGVADTLEVRTPHEVVLFLADQLPWARDRRAVEAAEVSVAGRGMPGLRQRAGTAVEWDDVPIGADSCLVAWLGAEASGALEFQVRVDDETVLRRTVAPGAPWRTELCDLRPFAGRRARLELRVEGPGAVATDGWGLWGRPILATGFERSPLAVWADSR